jgi:S-adenosylmethionine hydrolase
MKSKEKTTFKRTAIDNNGSVQINIPPEIAERLQIKPGNTIAIQSEYSDENGKYASFWNQSKQEGDKQ